MSAQIILNVSQIRDKIERFSLPKARNIGEQKARAIIQKKKSLFLEEFDNHEITKEIEAGPGKDIGVDEVKGNLFSFLGFDAGSNPTQDLREYFQQVITIVNSRGFYNSGNKTLTFKMRLPTPEGIKKVSDMTNYVSSGTWGTGRSWVYSIERGIPGLNKYKFDNSDEKEKILGGESRSSFALQRKNQIRGGSFKAKKYVTNLINNYLEGDIKATL